MATVTDKRKVLSVEEKFKVTQEVENKNNKKRKLTCIGSLVSWILQSKGFVKTEPKSLVRLNGTRRE
jgi:hypothetical protein